MAEMGCQEGFRRGATHFSLGASQRAGAVGKGREGVNPFPWFGIGGYVFFSTRPEARGLGGFSKK